MPTFPPFCLQIQACLFTFPLPYPSGQDAHTEGLVLILSAPKSANSWDRGWGDVWWGMDRAHTGELA